jgi:MFS family permease
MFEKVLTTFFSAVLLLALWIPGKNNAAIIAFCVLYGFASGASISLSPALIAQISPIRELGVRQGTFYAMIALASLVGNPIGGALVPDILTGDFWKLQVFGGVVMLAGTVAIILGRIAAGGTNPLKIV